MNKSKVLVIGLDGATWRVLKPLIAKNKLPFIKQLMKNGSSGILKSTYPPITAPAWVSFQTGANPGKHGIFGFLNYRKNPINPPIFTSVDIKSERIWETLDRFGMKSLIINMPVSYPVSEINGILVSSFLTPPGKKFASNIKAKKILNNLGYKIDILINGQYGQLPHKKLNAKEKSIFYNEIVDITNKRIEALFKLSKLDNFSLMFLLIKETDVMQHLFLGTKELEDYFIYLDGKLQQIHKYYNHYFPNDYNFIIVSDHGFHPISKWQFSIYKFLQDKGLFKNQKNMYVRGLSSLKSINRYLKRIGINIPKTETAYSINEFSKSKIQINNLQNVLKSNLLAVSEGIYFFGNHWSVKRIKVLIKLLKNFKYKNRYVFKSVKFSKEVYNGLYVKNGPDVVWFTNEKFSVDVSPDAQEVIISRITEIRGDHSADDEGIFITKGSSFKKINNQHLSIYDMYPLILHLLGVITPTKKDGVLPIKILSKQGAKVLSLREKDIEKKINKELNRIKINEQ